MSLRSRRRRRSRTKWTTKKRRSLNDLYVLLSVTTSRLLLHLYQMALQVSEESKSGSRIVLDKVTVTLADVGAFMDDTKGRYPQEKPRATIAVADVAAAPAPAPAPVPAPQSTNSNKRLSRRLFSDAPDAKTRRRGYPPALTANFSVTEVLPPSANELRKTPLRSFSRAGLLGTYLLRGRRS